MAPPFCVLSRLKSHAFSDVVFQFADGHAGLLHGVAVVFHVLMAFEEHNLPRGPFYVIIIAIASGMLGIFKVD